jgi:hypothetical protein
MSKATQANQTAAKRDAGAAAQEGTPGIGKGARFIRNLLRFARRRSRQAVAGKEADATSSRGRGPEHGSDAARSSMEAGLTRGVSLLFGELGSRR